MKTLMNLKLFADKCRKGRSDVEPDAQAVNRGGHVVQAVGSIATVDMLKPFVINTVCDVAGNLQAQEVCFESSFFLPASFQCPVKTESRIQVDM